MRESYSLGIERDESKLRRILVNIRTGEAIHEFDERDFNILSRMTVDDDRSRAIATLPGAGVASPSTIVIRLSGDQIDLLMNSRVEENVSKLVTPIHDAILPEFFGYIVQIDRIDDA